MIKKFLFSVLLGLSVFASPLMVGNSLPTLTIKDQFEKSHTVDGTIKTILFSASKDEGTTIKEFLLTKDKSFLDTTKTVYVADITGMPSIITSLFAMPKMKEYPFPVLLIDEANKTLFPVQEDMISIIKLDNGKITEVKYVKTIEDLQNNFK